MDTTVRLTDGAEIHVHERGEGEPLLLLHGLTGTGGDWRHAFDLDALAARYRILAVDARGHGRSTNPSGAFGYRRCGLDIVEILDHLGLPSARAIGLSLGAKSLLHAATASPNRFRAMVLVSAIPRFPEATRALLRSAAAALHTPEEWAAMRALHVHGDPQIAALWQLPAILAEKPEELSFPPDVLARITAPTLVVAGDRDPLYPVELAVELYRGIPNASLYVVPGRGHDPLFGSEREAFARRALAFLEAN
jgi:pimeloyl-ACP methyl ester carboxylesterase